MISNNNNGLEITRSSENRNSNFFPIGGGLQEEAVRVQKKAKAGFWKSDKVAPLTSNIENSQENSEIQDENRLKPTRSLISKLSNCFNSIHFPTNQWIPNLSNRHISHITIPHTSSGESLNSASNTSTADNTDLNSVIEEKNREKPKVKNTLIKDKPDVSHPVKSKDPNIPLAVQGKTGPSGEELRVQLEQRIDRCRELHGEIRKLRTLTLNNEKRDKNIKDYGFEKTRYERPLEEYSLKKATAIKALSEEFDKINALLKNPTKDIPTRKILRKQLKQEKQLLVLEEKLKRNLTLVNAKSLHAEYKVKKSEDNPKASQWEEVCTHFEIESSTDLEEQWQSLKAINQADCSLFVQKPSGQKKSP